MKIRHYTKSHRKGKGRNRRGRKVPFFMKQEPSAWPAVQNPLFESMREENHIILRPDHNISRKNIDKEALKVLYRLKDAGFTAYLVGGSVRDMLLGKKPKDFDIGTDARPEQIRKIFRHSRIIGKRFRLVHVYFRGGKIIEVSTFRKQTDYDDREAAREELANSDIYGTPREDASRRDLTINGLFYNIANFSIIDYVGGMSDLRKGIVRAIGDPERRFLRDPVRMLRAIRHASRTGFEIEPVTWKAIKANADKIRLCAIPRVRDEWLKDLQSGVSASWAELMLESGMLEAVFPGFKPVLHGDRGKETVDMLLKMLKRLDKLLKTEKQNIGEELQLAFLAYPFFHFDPEWRKLQSEKIRWPTYEARNLLHEIFHPYDFRNMISDQAAQILASQWPVKLCSRRGSWPKRVWSKMTFRDSVLLFNAAAASQGLPEIEDEPHTTVREGTNRRNRGRRRPRGKNRRQAKANNRKQKCS